MQAVRRDAGGHRGPDGEGPGTQDLGALAKRHKYRVKYQVRRTTLKFQGSRKRPALDGRQGALVKVGGWHWAAMPLWPAGGAGSP